MDGGAAAISDCVDGELGVCCSEINGGGGVVEVLTRRENGEGELGRVGGVIRGIGNLRDLKGCRDGDCI